MISDWLSRVGSSIPRGFSRRYVLDLLTEQPMTGKEIIDKAIVQYIRQSTGKQVKENIQSKIQQDTMLGKRLIKYGWTEDLIIKIDKDQGISGQKNRSQLLTWAAAEEIH